eukprot:m.307915 g.307915  ORF g.307915 m.307915 type:complete len:122 (-) comp27397_c1_seq2:4239-4604(-)
MYSVAIGVVVVVPSGAEPGLHLPLQEGKPIAPSAILAERHGDLPCRGESGVAVVLAVPVGVSDEGGDHIGGLVVDLQLGGSIQVATAVDLPSRRGILTFLTSSRDLTVNIRVDGTRELDSD